jgi:hypothetical protein
MFKAFFGNGKSHRDAGRIRLRNELIINSKGKKVIHLFPHDYLLNKPVTADPFFFSEFKSAQCA